jgi:hypothetical protein
MNEELPSTEQRRDMLPDDTHQEESRSADVRTDDPRRRLRELLAIPERDRTDASWDEIIGLEIQLAPENRVQSSSRAIRAADRTGAAASKAGRNNGDQSRRQQPQQPRNGPGGGGGRFFQEAQTRSRHLGLEVYSVVADRAGSKHRFLSRRSSIAGPLAPVGPLKPAQAAAP